MQTDWHEWNWKKIGTIGGGALLVVVVLYFLFFRGSAPEKVDHPDGFTMVCQNPACRHEFQMSLSQFEEFRAKHPGEPLPCPKCGGTEVIQKGARPNRPTAAAPAP